MDQLLGPLVIVGLFLLRLGVPLAVTLAVGYLLRRLDAKWEAEESARTETVPGERQAAARQPCWTVIRCGKVQRADCPAHKSPRLPCWLARLQAENRLPSGCPSCLMFAPQATA